MWWRWTRRRRRVRHGRWEPYDRIPDYDTVFPPGHPRHRPHWADLTRPVPADRVLDSPTTAYRTVRVPPWV